MSGFVTVLCRFSLCLGVLLLFNGCSAIPEQGPQGRLQQGVGIGGPCTDNSQCDNFDDDTRLIICNVPAGMMAGVCFDCAGAMAKPVGCACAADADCAMGLQCEGGRTCQARKSRGQFCNLDAECGTDVLGAMICLPTKSWCGPLVDGEFCDFQTDCLNGQCNAFGICTSGGVGDDCVADAECKAPAICSTVTFKCITAQADAAPCTRNLECMTVCNVNGLCGYVGPVGMCNPMNPMNECDPATGMVCTDCGGAYNCRMPGAPCD